MRRRFREEIASSPTAKKTGRHRRDGLPATDGPRRAEPLVGSRDDVQPTKRRVSTRPRRSAAARPGARRRGAGARRGTARARAPRIRPRAGFGRRGAFRPGFGVDGRAGGAAWRGRAEPGDGVGRRAPASTDEAAPNLADTPAEIAAELGLAGPVTPDQLASRWRNFVWRNHPDRQPARERDHAGARVAIANALYDRARQEPAQRR